MNSELHMPSYQLRTLLFQLFATKHTETGNFNSVTLYGPTLHFEIDISLLPQPYIYSIRPLKNNNEGGSNKGKQYP